MEYPHYPLYNITQAQNVVKYGNLPLKPWISMLPTYCQPKQESYHTQPKNPLLHSLIRTTDN
jgi:hypothetical protein